MSDFSIIMPIGQIRIVMTIPRLMDTIAHEVLQGEEVHYAHIPFETAFYGQFTPGDLPKPDAQMQRKIVPMKQTMDLHRAMMTGRVGSEELHNARTKFMAERFKEHASKKTTEFYVPDLTLAKVEELGYKYMENMGSDNGTLCIFKLSDYHKFAALVDSEAFRLFRNERGTHAELVELRPDKWVLGRYDNDLTIIKEMEGMRRYSPGTNSDG